MNKTTGTAVAGETKKDYIKTGRYILCKAEKRRKSGVYTESRK